MGDDEVVVVDMSADWSIGIAGVGKVG